MTNLRFLRITRNYSQLKVQMDTGICQSTLSKYETGGALPTLENLIILADYYQTSLDYLIDLTNNPFRYPRGGSDQRRFDH